MFTLCWSVKGGSGTSVVAASLALQRNGVLIDLEGESPAVLGVAEPPGPGVADWLAAAVAPEPTALERLATELEFATLVHRGGATQLGLPLPNTDRLASALSTGRLFGGRHVVVDAGCSPPPMCAQTADQSLIVVRPCYLALRRAVMADVRITGIVLVKEPGRALTDVEVQRVIGAPIVATVLVDPAIARAVDAGLLSIRLPKTLSRAADSVLSRLPTPSMVFPDRVVEPAWTAA